MTVLPLRRPAHRVGTRHRLTPRDGEPECLAEQLSQTVFAHRVRLYIAAVVTLSLIFQVFGVPFTGGGR